MKWYEIIYGDAAGFSSMLTKKSNRLKKIIVTTSKQKKKGEAERHTWKIQGIIDPWIR